MKKVSFTDLSDDSHRSALNKMLDHNQVHHHPSYCLWSSLLDVQDDLLFGYNPDDDFYFYLDSDDKVVVHIED